MQQLKKIGSIRGSSGIEWPPVHSTDPFHCERVPPPTRAQQPAGNGRDSISVVPDPDRGVETLLACPP